MNFSIHYSFSTMHGFHNLMTEINRRAINGKTKLMISFIDKDVLFKERDQIDFEDGGFFRKTHNESLSDVSSMTYYYPWRNNKVNNEKILGYSDLTEELIQYGWHVHNKYEYIHEYEMGGIQRT